LFKSSARRCALISSLFKKNNYEQEYAKILDDFVSLVEN